MSYMDNARLCKTTYDGWRAERFLGGIGPFSFSRYRSHFQSLANDNWGGSNVFCHVQNTLFKYLLNWLNAVPDVPKYLNYGRLAEVHAGLRSATLAPIAICSSRLPFSLTPVLTADSGVRPNETFYVNKRKHSLV